MSEWEKEIGAVVLFVEDLAQSTAFYVKVFGLTPVNEDENTAMFLLKNTPLILTNAVASNELIAPASVGSPNAGPRSQLSIIVEDVDAVCAELEKHGVTLLNGPIDRRWGMRTITFADPAGHVWEIAQEISNGGSA